MRWKIPKWTPFVEADYSFNRKTGICVPSVPNEKVYINSRYQVTVRELDGGPPRGVSLSIRNLDRSARHDWRDFQRIKNELLGPEWEAVEIYPAESRLVDTANQFWLWAVEPPMSIPFGFSGRLVSESGFDFGAEQRPWEADNKPSDLVHITKEMLMEAAEQQPDLKDLLNAALEGDV